MKQQSLIFLGFLTFSAPLELFAQKYYEDDYRDDGYGDYEGYRDQDIDDDNYEDIRDDYDRDNYDRPTTKKRRFRGSPQRRQSIRERYRELRSKRRQGIYYSSLGAGKTLPKGFYRFRAISQIIQGIDGFDAKGKKIDEGFDVNFIKHGLVTEYGVNKKLSLQLLIPHTSKHNVGFTPTIFKSSDRFNTIKGEFEGKVATLMIAQGLCAEQAECLSQTLASALSLPLPTGEIATLSAGSTPSDALADLISNSAQVAPGQTGVGDVQLGATYLLKAKGRAQSGIGFGIRVPTGSFEDVPESQPTLGEGMTMAAIRYNYDYRISKPMWFSFQHQAEFMLLEGRRQKSSLLDPNVFNEADPTTDEAVLAGSDGGSNEQLVTQPGLSHQGFLRLDYGLSDYGKNFDAIAVEGLLKYRLGSDILYGDTVYTPGSEALSIQLGAKYDGLALKSPIPGYIKVARETFFFGKNIPIAPDILSIELALYTSF